MQLVLDGHHFQWTFLLAAVQCPIIGVDFLCAHQLLVDPFNSRLLDLLSLRFLKADTDKPQLGCPGISSVDKTEGGCGRAPVAHSTPPWPSPPSLPQVVASSSTSPRGCCRHCPTSQQWWLNFFLSFRMSSIPPSSYRQLSTMCSTTSRQLGLRWPPDFAPWKEPSFRQPEQNSTRWSETVS